MRGSIIGLTVVALAAPAVAEPTQVGMCPRFSGHFQDDFAGLAMGSGVEVWRPHGRWLVGGEAEIGRLWLNRHQHEDIPTIYGWTGRAGVNARYILGTANIAVDFGIQGWAQIGVGVHAIQWDRGGRLVRPDVAVGIGFSEVLGRRFALDVGLVVAIGHTGDGPGVPTCAGPCDERTAPVREDVELIDHFAIRTTW